MTKNQEIANSVLNLVGGASNITEVLHCMTRLRIKFVNKDLIDLEKIKAVKGVYGAQFAEGALQVVIGPTVDEVYDELIAATGLEAKAMIDENLDADMTKKKISIKSVGSGIVNTFSNCMTPLIPLFVAMGMFNVIATVIGPTVLNLVSTDSPIYTNFYYVGQAIIYFLPIFVAITAAKQFKCNPMVAVALAALMLYPDIITALGGDVTYTVYGIPAANVTYSSQIIPILLVVFAQSYIERLFKKIIPNAIRVFGVPFCTLLIMLPITFCALGPVGYYIGLGLTKAILWLYAVAGPVATMLLGASSLFLTAFGIGRPIFFACLAVFMANGSEAAYMPIAMVVQNFVVWGAALGYSIKVKSADKRQLGIAGFASGILGGVSEPILFGIIIPNRKTYLPIIIAGGLSGLLVGLFGVTYYQFGPSNFLGVVGFLGGATSNFVWALIASIVGFVAAFLLMLLMYKEKKEVAPQLSE